MKTPILIAETPNAGKWGYRFLISDGANIGDTIVSAFVSKGRGESLIGGNYLAVRHNVIQRSTGRPDAGETLILVGVDTSQISNEKQEQIIASLRSLLDKLDAVVQEIDWTNEKRLVVPHRSLAEWLSKDICSLPTADITGGPQELGRPTVPTNNALPRQSSRNPKTRSLAILVLILFFLTAVALIIGKWPFRFGSDVVATSDNRGQQEERENPHANNSTNRDEFADNLEKLKREVSVAQESNQLKDIQSRLNELEQPRLTKNQKREIEDLRSEINTKVKSINEKQDTIKNKNKDYLQKIEDDLLSGAKDQEKLKLLLTRLDKVPHPDKLTEEQREWQKLLAADIKWKIFEVKYHELVSRKNFTEAAEHLFEWKEAKQQELNELKKDYKTNFELYLKTTLDQYIQQTNFNRGRQFIQELEEFPDVIKIVGESLFQHSKQKLDVAQDKYLYEKIINSRSNSRSLDDKMGNVNAYLESQVPDDKKRMKQHVEELKRYLDTYNNEKDITLSISNIKWGSNCIPDRKTVELIVISDGNKKSSSGQVLAKPGQESQLDGNPIKISIKAKLNARITLKVQVYNSKREDNDTYFYNKDITILGLAEDEWHKLSIGNRIASEIKFKVEGIPKEPGLPPWK